MNIFFCKEANCSFSECSQEKDDCEGSHVCGLDRRCRPPCGGSDPCDVHGISGFYLKGEGDCDSDAECREAFK